MAGRSKSGNTFNTRLNGKTLTPSDNGKKEIKDLKVKIPENDRNVKEPLIEINQTTVFTSNRRGNGKFKTVKVNDDNLVNISGLTKNSISSLSRKSRKVEEKKRDLQEEEDDTEEIIPEDEDDVGSDTEPNPNRRKTKTKTEKSPIIYGMFFHNDKWYYISDGLLYTF